MGVREETDGPVRVVTIDRPRVRNAVDRPTAEALCEAFDRFEGDEAARIAVLTGAGGNFCAGADLRAAAEGGHRANRLERSVRAPMGPTRMRLSKPTLAAIEGHAVAGGLELALWADLRVVAEDAVLGVFSRRWGVPLVDGGTVRLPRLIGQGRALDLVLTGRAVHAPEALEIGLASRLVAPGTALQAAVDLAHEIAALPQTTMLADRASVLAAGDLTLDEGLLAEHETGVGAIESGGMAEGVARFAAGEGRHGQGVSER